MYLLASVAAFSLFVLLLLEGLSFFGHTEHSADEPALPHPPHLRLFGGLTLIIALPIGLLQVLLLVRSTLIYSPEFGAFLVQGMFAKYLLGVAIGTIAIASTLLWHVARVADSPEKAKVDRMLVLMMAAGAIVAFSSVREIHSLQSGTDPAVYAFDLWWPPLVAWLTICLIKAGEVMVGITGKFRRPAVTCLALFLVSVIASQRPEFVDGRSSEWWSILGGFATLGFLILAGIGLFRRGEVGWWSWLKTRVNEYRSLRYKSVGQMVVAMLPVLAFGRIIRLETAGPSLALSALVFVWIVLAEAFGGEPLIQASRWPIIKSLRRGGTIRATMTEAWDNVRKGASAAAERFWPARQKDVPEVPREKPPFASTAVKALIGLAILIVVSDIPNIRRTIIYPFDPGDLAADKALAQEFPTWVLREIDVLQRELAPLMIVGNRQDRDQRIEAAPVVNGIDAAISKSSDLEYGSVKIPLSLFIVPIQTPLRRVIGARVITGTLHGDSESFSTVAMSSSGEIWSASAPAISGGAARKPVDALNVLASRLAFEIVATSIPPAAGLTRSEEAFADFRDGIAFWNEYQQDNWDALSKAIDAFREAVKKDPTFSLAYYRLGVALQEEARPSAAAEAFTASISANQTFAPSYVAKANVLYNFAWYKERLPAADAVGGPAGLVSTAADDESSPVAASSRLEEARRLWRKVLTFDEDIVSLSDRASSYFGLCTDAHEQFKADTDAAYSAYYYCRRAADLYTEMHSTDQQILTNHSWVLDTLGLIFEQRQQTATVRDTADWHCSASTIDFENVSDAGTISKRRIVTGPYLADALGYYERALALTPLDPVVRCNAASVTYAMGDTDRMHALEGTAEAHSELAAGISDENHPIRAHRVALNEYREAVIRDPADTDARNAYAYRFWEWQYAAAQSDLPPPDEEVATRAEEYAREAVRVGSLKTGAESHQAMLMSTLGEVLLARGRPHEALWHLRKAKDIAPAHTAFDQVRWDLAQADRCAAASDRDRNRPDLADEIRTDLNEAQQMTALIDAHERAGESPRPDGGRWLDMSRPSTACVTLPEPSAPMLQMTRRTGATREPCDWMGVAARIDDPGAPLAYLRILGGDTRERVAVEPDSYVFLTAVPAPSHGDYFARLEDEDGKALSRTEAFDTTADCSQNLITLVYQNVAGSAPVQTTRSTGDSRAESVSPAGLRR